MLNPELNKLPERLRHIHFMGICGVGMASLAGMLKEKGYHITGSDSNPYPPMSTYLADLGIPVFNGYRGDNLYPMPDLVIVGNVITKDNPEAVKLAVLPVPYLSFPQAVRNFAIRNRRSIVIAGTHGKTTTTGFCAFLLYKAGLDPGFLVGGIPLNFGKGFRDGKGEYFVIEGDEYDSSFFDKGPKFLHYSPWILVITGIEFDHADIYRDIEHVKENFERLIEIIPEDGGLIVNYDDPVSRELSKNAGCRVIGYGIREEAEVMARNIHFKNNMTRFDIEIDNRVYVSASTSLFGLHNVSNMLSVSAVAHVLGIEPESFSVSAIEFRGIKRRLEAVAEVNDILIIDDFAHHPTEVRASISAVKERFKHRRVFAVFEPRSNTSRRDTFQGEYVFSFDMADVAIISEPPLMKRIPPHERFSSVKLVEDLRERGIEAYYFGGASDIIDNLSEMVEKGDIVLIMSNGSFDNILFRFIKRLRMS